MVRSVSKPESPTIALESGVEVVELPASEGSKGGAPDSLSLAERFHVVRGRNRPSALESLINPPVDNRTRILETTLTPWRMVCALEIESEFGSNIPGTGWLVGPSTVITAGHCVHALERGGWATKIKVTPGQNGADETPFGSFESDTLRCTETWRDDADPDYDVGCIHLPEPVGNTTGWFGTRAIDDAELMQWNLNLAGYPLTPGSGVEQLFHSNTVHKLTDRRVYYQIDTTSGNSGGPVWIQADDSESPPFCVAIHAYSVGDGINANSGPRINTEVFDLIQGWVAEAAE